MGPIIALTVFVFLALGVAVARGVVRRAHRTHEPHQPIPIHSQEPPGSDPPSHARTPTGIAGGFGTLATVESDLEQSGSPFLPLLAVPEPHQVRRPTLATDRLDTSVSALLCGECRSQFDLGGQYCPHDGSALHLIETDAIAESEDPMACSICGDAHPAHVTFCPKDGGRLVPTATASVRFVPLAIPVCPTCHTEFPPELRNCPDDGTPLIPMLGRRTCGYPILGVGPKRKICPECGLRYGDDMQVCTRDRARLVGLN
jgi:DNA-directed RNA polymerase subunit M/transcription elongation factor TFIIS